MNSGYQFKKEVISPEYVEALGNVTYNIKSGGRFFIDFYTPYNTFRQELAIEIDSASGLPLQAYNIYKGIKKELIGTYYPENFPIPYEEIDFIEALSEAESENIKKLNSNTLR